MHIAMVWLDGSGNDQIWSSMSHIILASVEFHLLDRCCSFWWLFSHIQSRSDCCGSSTGWPEEHELNAGAASVLVPSSDQTMSSEQECMQSAPERLS